MWKVIPGAREGEPYLCLYSELGWPMGGADLGSSDGQLLLI